MRRCNDSICEGYFYADMWGMVKEELGLLSFRRGLIK